MNILVRVLRLEEQQLGHDKVGHVVLYRTHDKYDALFQQPGINVVGALTPGGLLDHHGNQSKVIDCILVLPVKLK